MDKLWKIDERKFDDLVDQILFNRSIIRDNSDQKQKEDFLNPAFFSGMHNPKTLPDYEKFIERIKKAKENNEHIGIFADYDADGVPGAALLYKTLTKIGIKSFIYIPSRDEGYGLNRDGIDYLILKKCTLIISIDLGIKSFKEAIYCKKKKIDLMITDHHLPDRTVPKSYAVIDPKMTKSKYPFRELCGCGVIFKLLTGLSKHFPIIDEKYLKWNLDLVAISTISDMVPLIGENRVIAKYGLIVLSKTKNIGLKSLYQHAGIDKNKINTYTVGFGIGPRLNTPGRIDHAVKSFELLSTNNSDKAEELAIWLNEKNQIRQDQMDKVFEEANRKILDNKLNENKIIIVSGKWSKGILGPPASKLVDKYYRPVILFSEDGQEYTGSARSVSGLDIISLLKKTDQYLTKYGGHKGAAGLSVKRSNYNKFVSSLKKISEKEIDDSVLNRVINIDAELAISELTYSLYKDLERLEPYGLGNPKPIFLISNISIVQAKMVGTGLKHLSSHICKDYKKIKSIYFNYQGSYPSDEQTKYDIVFSIDEDNWNGDNNISLNIIDTRQHEKK